MKFNRGKLNKGAIKDFVNGGCARKLWFKLGNGRPRWGFQRPIPERGSLFAMTVAQEGNWFEDRVYQQLYKNDRERVYLHGQTGEDRDTHCTPELWKTYYETLKRERGCRLLLEHQWPISKRLAGLIFHLSPEMLADVQVDSSSLPQSIPTKNGIYIGSGDRPDTILLEWIEQEALSHLVLRDGQMVVVHEPRVTGLKISVIDVKHTLPEKCAKHFPEVVYYVYSLWMHLLDCRSRLQGEFWDQIYLPVDGHGIFGRQEENILRDLTVSDFQSHSNSRPKITPMPWLVHHRGWTKATAQIRKLYARTNQSTTVADIRPKMDSGCAMCSFVDYCLPDVAPAQPLPYEIHRMPFGSPSTIALLEDRFQIRSFSELHAQMSRIRQDLQSDSIPTILHNRLPLFHLRTLAILQKQAVWSNSSALSDAWRGNIPRTLHLPSSSARSGLAFLSVEREQVYGYPVALGLRIESTHPSLFEGIEGAQGNWKRVFVPQSDNRMELMNIVTAFLKCFALFQRRVKRAKLRPLSVLVWDGQTISNICELAEEYGGALEPEDEQIIRDWFPKPATEVSKFDRNSHLYILQQAVQDTVGLPLLYRYTWHGTHQALLGSEPQNFRSAFWGRYLNYLDFSFWHVLNRWKDYEHLSADGFFQKTAEETSGKTVTEVVLKALGIAKPLDIREEMFVQVHSKMAALSDIFITLTQNVGTHTTDYRQRASWEKRYKGTKTKWNGYATFLMDYFMQEFHTAKRHVYALESQHPMAMMGQFDGLYVDNIQVQSGWRDTVVLDVHPLSRHSKISEGGFLHLIVYDDDVPPKAMIIQEQTRKGVYRNKSVQISDLRYHNNKTQIVLSFRNKLNLGEHNGRSAKIMKLESKPWWVHLHMFLEEEEFAYSNAGNVFCQQFQLPETKQPRTDSNAHLFFYTPYELPRRDLTPLTVNVSPAPDVRQKQAIEMSLSHPVSCILGPPGTGKTQTIVTLLCEWLHRRGNQENHILLSAFTYNAMWVVVERIRSSQHSMLDAIPIVLVNFSESIRREASRHQHVYAVDRMCTAKGNSTSIENLVHKTLREQGVDLRSVIVVANAHSLAKSLRYKDGRSTKVVPRSLRTLFDLIVLDESSQLPPSHFFAHASVVRSRETQIVLIGDDQQLAPVLQQPPPDKFRPIGFSIFEYYRSLFEQHAAFHSTYSVPMVQLETNYRSLPDIVAAFAGTAEGSYKGLQLYADQLTVFRVEDKPAEWLARIPEHIQDTGLRSIVSPNTQVGVLCHRRNKDTVMCPLEAKIVAQVVLASWKAWNSSLRDSSSDEERLQQFWTSEVGVVSPHNAHGALIKQEIFTLMITEVPQREEQLNDLLKNAVVSVEKFQGDSRRFIIGSIGVSAEDRLASEEAFLYNSNRVNVLMSRPKDKLLLVCSQSFLDYVGYKEEVQHLTTFFRLFAENFCNSPVHTGKFCGEELRYSFRT